jgi:hypothetical protein
MTKKLVGCCGLIVSAQGLLAHLGRHWHAATLRDTTRHVTRAGIMSGALPGSSPISINLIHHEQLGGHTIATHVGKTVGWLQQRLVRDPTIPAASSFYDINTAENAINQALQANHTAFHNWLASKSRVSAFDHDVGYAIGTMLPRNPPTGVATPLQATKVRVVVERLTGTYPNFRIQTAFPIL